MLHHWAVLRSMRARMFSLKPGHPADQRELSYLLKYVMRELTRAEYQDLAGLQDPEFTKSIIYLQLLNSHVQQSISLLDDETWHRIVIILDLVLARVLEYADE